VKTVKDLEIAINEQEETEVLVRFKDLVQAMQARAIPPLPSILLSSDAAAPESILVLEAELVTLFGEADHHNSVYHYKNI